MGNTWSTRLALVAAAWALTACSKGTEPPTPTTIVVTPAGPVAFASLNQTLKLTAKVFDQHGDSMSGQVLTWTSNSVAIATVDPTGLVTAKGNGSATITVATGSIHLDIGCAVAQTATNFFKQSGDGQVFSVGGALPAPLDARILDALGSPVVGVTVTFAVTQGGGSLSSVTAMTNASGDATTTWTLGTTAGAQLVTASATGLTTLTFSATANAGAPKNVAINGGNNQTWVVGGAVPVAPSVKVSDQYANAVSGAQVVFSVPAGSGSVTGATQLSNANGVATVGSWTLGNAGVDTLVATVSAVPATVKILATAQSPGAPATVTVVAGGSAQTALVGYATNIRPAIKVTDASGLPVNNAAVTFAVGSGGGSVSGGTLNTNANGIAQVGSWTVGAAPGSNTLSATVTGSGITGNPASFTATGASPTFNITLQNIGPTLSAPVQLAFDSAVAKWQRIIYQDVPDVANFTATAGQCGPSPAIGPTNIDDVLILLKFDSIDGPGKILGQAGPCFIRTSGFLTIMGIMQFDTADVAGLISNGSLNEVILHEMGHVLGFGTLWGSSYFNCLQNPSSTGNLVDTYYSCNGGRVMFDSIGGTSYTGGNKVPLENCVGITGCGAGTFNAHWRESTFFNELMTGYLNTSVPNPLSVLSIAAMGDLGYVVNNAAADSYSRTFSSAPALRLVGAGGHIELGDDVLHLPIRVVDRSGRIVRVIAPQ